MATWWNSAYVTAVARKALKDSLVEEAELIAAASSRLVPLNKRDRAHRGTLQRLMQVTSDDDSVSIRYYAENRGFPYAPVQHENLSYTHEPGLIAKYLKVPFDTVTGNPSFFARVQTNTRRRMRFA